jgi:peptidyl-prolyl cis-trans isomerase A (cyclophilin A)
MKRSIIAISVFIAAVAGLMNTSCDPAKRWENDERNQVEDFLATRGDTVYEKKPSGLYFVSLAEGTGDYADRNDTAFIRFTGYFLDYRIFDTNLSLSKPLSFIVGSGIIIKGIDEGVTYMKKGGKAKMITPSALAYGTMGIRGILSGYTPLVWNIELVDLRPAAKK